MSASAPTQPLSRWLRLGPIWTLLLLAPLIGEVLPGTTRLSFLFVFIPEIMVWGCGALIIRELVRRNHKTWSSMAILGLALGVAEEFVIQQTSLAPIVGVAPDHIYGRLFGVNWVWFVALVVFECVWIVLVPVFITELVFRSRRDVPWLTNRGLVISGIIFLFGSWIAWFLWVRRARPLAFHVPVYNPPLSYLIVGLIVTAALILLALRLSSGTAPSLNPARRAPHPWIVGLFAAVFTLPWYVMIGLSYGIAPRLPVPLAIAAGVVWALLAYSLIRRWSSSPAWNDLHRYALAFGTMLALMGGGFVEGNWYRPDLIFKIVTNLVAVLLLLLLGRRLLRAPDKSA